MRQTSHCRRILFFLPVMLWVSGLFQPVYWFQRSAFLLTSDWMWQLSFPEALSYAFSRSHHSNHKGSHQRIPLSCREHFHYDLLHLCNHYRAVPRSFLFPAVLWPILKRYIHHLPSEHAVYIIDTVQSLVRHLYRSPWDVAVLFQLINDIPENRFFAFITGIYFHPDRDLAGVQEKAKPNDGFFFVLFGRSFSAEIIFAVDLKIEVCAVKVSMRCIIAFFENMNNEI